MRWVGYETYMGEKRNIYRVLVGKLEEKRQTGIPTRKC
jgi:hypothetical protein